MSKPIPENQHGGDATGYKLGCECHDCYVGRKLYEYQLAQDHWAGQRRRVDPGPSRRKIQALMAMGYGTTEIGRGIGIQQQYLSRVINGRTAYMFRRTAERIDAWYRVHEMKTPPATPWSARTKNLAKRRGYLPPLAWEDIEVGIVAVVEPFRKRFDEELIDRAVVYHDFSERLNARERREVVLRWTAAGGARYDLQKLSGWNVGYYAPKEAS